MEVRHCRLESRQRILRLRNGARNLREVGIEDLADRGGQEILLVLARGLRRRGHEQTIVCPENSALSKAVRGEGFSVSRLTPCLRLKARITLAALKPTS
jgi:hypothetical protein